MVGCTHTHMHARGIVTRALADRPEMHCQVDSLTHGPVGGSEMLLLSDFFFGSEMKEMKAYANLHGYLQERRAAVREASQDLKHKRMRGPRVLIGKCLPFPMRQLSARARMHGVPLSSISVSVALSVRLSIVSPQV